MFSAIFVRRIVVVGCLGLLLGVAGCPVGPGGTQGGGCRFADTTVDDVDTNDNGIDDVNDNAMDDGNDNGIDDGVDVGNDNGVDDGNDNGADNVNDNDTETPAQNELTNANPLIVFDELVVGETIALIAPEPPFETETTRRQLEGCTCAWSVAPESAGTFSTPDECETDFTLDEPGDFTVTVLVECDDGRVAEFDQDGTAAAEAAGAEVTADIIAFDAAVDERSLVTLDGSGSAGSGFGVLTFEWSLIATTGPQVVIDDPSADVATFTAPDVSCPSSNTEELTFQLTVSEGESEDTAEVTVIVQNIDGCAPPPPSAVCGNGVIEGGEACDDEGETADCDDDCTAVECGDGNVNEAAGEFCDDGGESATCDDDCSLVMCGDGNVNEAFGEECDPPEMDVCDTECQFIVGACCNSLDASCTNGTPVDCMDANEVFFQGEDCAVFECPLCGDGIEAISEDCDDGSECDDGTPCTDDPGVCGDGSCAPRDGDGCSSGCEQESVCCDYSGGLPAGCTNTLADGCQGVNLFIFDNELCDTFTCPDTMPPSITDCPVSAVDVEEDGQLQQALTVDDEDLLTVGWEVTTPATNGTATLINCGTPCEGETATADYVPFDDYSGPDSFTITVTDQEGVSGTCTIDVNVTEVNDFPEELTTSATLITGVSNSASNVIILGARDVDSADLTFVIDTLPATGKLFDLRAAGPDATDAFEFEITTDGYTLSFNGGATPGGNRVRYEPDANSTPASFTWHAVDGDIADPADPVTLNISFTGWFPPIGVPTPDFDFDQPVPALPDPWDDPVQGFYCLSNNGDDANNEFGSLANPRQSMPNPVPAGSVVAIHGFYDFVGGGNKISIIGEGTDAQPIFVVGVGGTIGVTTAVSGSYVIVDHLEFDSSGTLADLVISGDTDHVVVRHCELHGIPQIPQGGAMVVNGGNGATCRDVVIFDNDIHDNGNFDVNSGENDVHGVTVRNDTDRVWVIDNRMYRHGGDGAQINFGAGTPTSVARQTYIARNLMYHNREDAVDIKGSSQVVVSQNIAYGYRITGSSGAFPFLPHAQQNRPEDIWILFNEAFDAEGGMLGNDVDGLHVIGNIFWGMRSFDTDKGANDVTRGGTGIQLRNCEHVFVYGNTIYDTEMGIGVLDQGNGIAAHISGNLVANLLQSDTGVEYRHLLVNDEQHGGAFWDNSDIDHNLVFQSGGESVLIRWRNTVFASVADFVAGGELVGLQGTGMLEADPLLNFHNRARLMANSPAVDAGVYAFQDGGQNGGVDYLARFQEQFGVDLRFDIEGNARPAGDADWDIGAHEGTE